MIGVAMVMLATAPVTRGSMSEATISYGGLTYTGTAGLQQIEQPLYVSAEVRINIGTETRTDSSYGGVSALLSVSLVDAYANADVSTAGSSLNVEAHPSGGVEAMTTGSFLAFSMFSVTDAGNLSVTVPYAYTVDATTQNAGDWARMYGNMSATIEDLDTGETLAQMSVDLYRSSFDGTSTGAQVGDGLWILNADLQQGQTVQVSWGSGMMGNAITADVAPVPLPGAALLAVTGLGYAGMWLRRRA